MIAANRALTDFVGKFPVLGRESGRGARAGVEITPSVRLCDLKSRNGLAYLFQGHGPAGLIQWPDLGLEGV
jgi:hypothetical protein